MKAKTVTAPPFLGGELTTHDQILIFIFAMYQNYPLALISLPLHIIMNYYE